MGILIGNESMLQAKRTLKIARIQGNDAPRHTPDFDTPVEDRRECQIAVFWKQE
jgi:hypothetical protein